MISEIEKHLLEGNLKFKSKLMQGSDEIINIESFPKYPVLFLTCIDPRIDILRTFQLNPGDVFIFRNAGNIFTNDVLRSIIFAVVNYSIKYIIVLGHLNCGMRSLNLRELRNKLPSKFLSSLTNYYADLLPKLRDFFKPFDNEAINIKFQIKRLEKIKEFFPKIQITGMLYDVRTGLVFEYESFQDYHIDKDFNEKYKEMLVKKKVEFTNFLDTIVEEKGEINIPKENFHEVEPSEIESSANLEVTEVDEDIIENNQDLTEGHYIETLKSIIPKIKVPKIQFHGVKIHIPQRFKEKKEIK